MVEIMNGNNESKAMKKNIIYISAAAIALLFSACERVEEIEAPVSGQMEEMRFVASIESGADTKTMIDGNVGDETRYLKWLPGDAIGVYNGSSGKFEKFVNVNAETSASGVFEGANTVQDVYYAVYPYSELHSYADREKIMTVDLPIVQNYAENTFGNGANPMVAHAESGEELMFQNLCGVLVINLTGEVSVKSMTLSLLDESGNLAPVSGKHTVSMDYIESPTLMSTEESQKTVTLDCGEGVALNAAEPTPFHVVLPSGTYSGITVSVLTTDGGIMVKQGKKSLRIRRSRVTSAGAFQHQSEIAVDLSERGTSNCYIVSEPGAYSFDATVIGNGEFGLVPNAGFHTDNVNIAPSAVELLWEDVPGLVQSVYCVNGRAGFYCSGKEGNAVLAAKDASGNIIWSWHIWATDKPMEQVYENSLGTFMVQDRNLGATRADRGNGDEWKEGKGVLYQWGRKDPIVEGCYTLNDTSWEQFSINESIQKPTVLPFANSNWDWWMTPDNDNLWSSVQKTIYDPCPMGYKVPHKDIWNGFVNEDGSLNVSGRYDNGWYFIVNEGVVDNLAWYSANDYITYSGRYHGRLSETDFWHDTPAYSFHIEESKIEYSWFDTSYHSTFSSLHVRCMKDEEYVDISLPQVEISGFEAVTTTSAKVLVKVKSAGVSDVTERGIIWGTTEDLSGGTKIVSEVAADEYAIELTGLQKSTKYYVKPYAVNSRGESTGLVKSFRTKYSDTETDLSSEGTANCYIVRYPGTHSFDCTVKGNSKESVGEPASVEVLWETDNTSTPISSGDVVSDVQIGEGGRVIFEASGKPGNALIAVKDVDGVILWSWHIWSSDYDPNETAQTYLGRAVMMDRNLGALNVEKGDVLSWGLFYQQGRKDPFIGCGDIEAKTFAATVPSDVISYSSNGGNEFIVQNPYYLTQNFTFAWSDEKSMMDPCPPGWKVPASSVFNGFTNGDTSVPYSMVFTTPLSSPDAYFPLTGDTENGIQQLRNPGTTSYMWTTEQGHAYCIHAGSKHSRSMYDENPVRCMKE